MNTKMLEQRFRYNLTTREGVIAGLIFILSVSLLLAGCGKQRVKPDTVPVDAPEVAEQTISARHLWSQNFEQTASGNGLQTYVADEILYGVSAKGYLAALDISNGKIIWDRKLKEPISAGVGYGEGFVAVVTAEGDVLALDDENGDENWRTVLGRPIVTPPVIGRGVILVRSIDGQMFGLSTSSGDKLWQFERAVPSLTLQGGSRPLIDGTAFVAGFASGRLIAGEIDSGKILWEADGGQARGRNEIERISDIDTDPVLLGSHLYLAAYQSQITALDLAKRSVMWQQAISSFQPLAVDLDHVYVSDDNSILHALDRRTGEEVWKQDAIRGRRSTGPEVMGDSVFVGDMEGYIYAFDNASGTLQGRIRAGRNPLSQLRAIEVSTSESEDNDTGANQHLLVKSEEGRLSLYAITQ